MDMLLNLLFLLAMLLLVWLDQKSFGSAHHRDFKSTIISLGILGTFLGIYLGLQGFDTQAIEGSIPRLLEGLKVAFFTSIAGMGLALGLSTYQKLTSPKESDPEAALLEHLAELPGIKSGIQESTGQIESLRKEHGVRLLQMQTELSKRIDATNARLERGLSSEMIESLGQVMREFTIRLEQQFGSNFARLDDALGKMLEWQEHYRHTLSETTQGLSGAIAAIQESQKTLSSLQAQGEQVLNIHTRLGALLESHEGHIGALNEHLERFGTLNTQGGALFESLTKGAHALQGALEESFSMVAQNHAAFTQQVHTTQESLLEAIRMLGHEGLVELHTLQTGLHESLAKSGEALLKEQSTHASALSRQFASVMSSLEASSSKEREGLAALHQEIRTHLTTLDSSLAAMSTRFAQDYGWFLQRVQELIGTPRAR